MLDGLLIFFEILASFESECTEAVIQRCSVKKVFLEISQKSQENTCPKVSDKRLCHMCFPVNLAMFLRTSFSQNTFGRLLLIMVKL